MKTQYIVRFLLLVLLVLGCLQAVAHYKWHRAETRYANSVAAMDEFFSVFMRLEENPLAYHTSKTCTYYTPQDKTELTTSIDITFDALRSVRSALAAEYALSPSRGNRIELLSDRSWFLLTFVEYLTSLQVEVAQHSPGLLCDDIGVPI